MRSSRFIGRSARAAALLVALCLGAPALTACGDSGGDEEEIEAAVVELQQAFAAGNTDRVCGLLSTPARKHVEGMGHGTSGPCYLDLYMFVEGVLKSPTWRDRTAREVTDISVEGASATATVRFEDGQAAALPLVREEGEWKVDALYGGIPASRQEDNY